jgi:Rrf2 family iron-sulfur cluster assembly transcriptional regulator
MAAWFTVSERLHSALILVERLARSEELVRITEVATELGLSVGYLEEVAGRLKRAGLVEAKTGPSGGYRLARALSEVSFLVFVEAVEGPMDLVACQSKTGCVATAVCRSRHVWDRLQRQLKTQFQSMTLSDVLA